MMEKNGAKNAFEIEYVTHGGEEAFLNHLAVQKNHYKEDPR